MALPGVGESPVVMGILNVTPDSFSDGGRFQRLDAALERAQQMVDEGALILDVGGESTRPGAQRIDPEVQIARVVPVIRELQRQLGERVMLSIDTSSSVVARAALDVGATLVNDVSAGRDSPDMLAVVAAHQVPIVLMHMQGQPETMQHEPVYGDVVDEVCAFLHERVQAALQAGIERRHIVVDPGIGFGKRAQHNLTLLRELARIVALGHPVLVGASRKRFMGRLCAETEPEQLLGATCAVTALAVAAGARIVRVHDVRANRQAADIAWALAADAATDAAAG